jgi:hypothetical protein
MQRSLGSGEQKICGLVIRTEPFCKKKKKKKKTLGQKYWDMKKFTAG